MRTNPRQNACWVRRRGGTGCRTSVIVYLLMPSTSLCRLVAASLFLVCVFACPRLRAESMRLTVDWGRTFAQAQEWAREQGRHKDPRSSIASLRHDVDEESSLFGTNPRVSLVL